MDAPVELLVLMAPGTAGGSDVETMVQGLAENGYTLDLCDDLGSAQSLFLERGGHRGLILWPSVPPGKASQVLRKLRAVDPKLPVIAFGATTRNLSVREPFHCIRSFAPGSRAGIGALQKVLASL